MTLKEKLQLIMDEWQKDNKPTKLMWDMMQSVHVKDLIALIEENERLKRVMKDYKEPVLEAMKAYDNGVLDERERCAQLVESNQYSKDL